MEYNRSEIMKEAWRLLRRGLPSVTNMSQALKRAWAKAKRRMAIAIENAASLIENERRNAIERNPIVSRLIAAGGRFWENYGKCRVYFNRPAIFEICSEEIEINFYKSGNISYAAVNGEEISNSRGRDLLAVIDNGIYYDVDNGDLVTPHCGSGYWLEFMRSLMKSKLAI